MQGEAGRGACRRPPSLTTSFQEAGSKTARLALYDVPEWWIWRISALHFAVPMLSLQVTYPR